MQSHIFTTVLYKNKTISKTIKDILASGVPTEILASTPRAAKQADPLAAKRGKELLPTLVDKLGTSLAVPEEYVIKQDDEGSNDNMYFIGKGDCEVHVRDQKGNDHEGLRLLVEGDHFGELALIYRCRRTASVVSRNYNTLARMTAHRFRELAAEYPEYESSLKEHIMAKYRDPRIQFQLAMLQHIDYLKNVELDILFEIMLNLKQRSYGVGETVLAENNNADSIIFVEYGVVEVYTMFDQNEFVLERLFRGSVLNQRAFFMQDSMYVDVRSATSVKTLELSYAKMKEIQDNYSSDSHGFSTQVLAYQNRILKLERKFPLDYILRVPTKLEVLDESQVHREN